MIGLQPIHILIIILVGLIIFAPGRLPLVIRGWKKMVSEVKKGATDDIPRDRSQAGTNKKSDLSTK